MAGDVANGAVLHKPVEIAGLSHRYRARSVLKDLSFGIGRGVTVILGPNGAGKSTLLRILATTERPSSGCVRIAGNDLASDGGRTSARALTGYLPQRFTLMSWRSAVHNVAYAAWANGVAPRACLDVAHVALDRVGLGERARDRVRTLSGGMRQRVGLACATAHNPVVLLLDEPAVGLDPVQRMAFRESLERVKDETAVVMTTHMTDDVERSADRVIVLNEGSTAFVGSVQEFVGLAAPGLSGGEAVEHIYRSLVQSSAVHGT